MIKKISTTVYILVLLTATYPFDSPANNLLAIFNAMKSCMGFDQKGINALRKVSGDNFTKDSNTGFTNYIVKELSSVAPSKVKSTEYLVGYALAILNSLNKKDQFRIIKRYYVSRINSFKDSKDLRYTRTQYKNVVGTLESWIEELVSSKYEKYPMWLKIWAIESAFKRSTIDFKNFKTGERTQHSKYPLPHVVPKALETTMHKAYELYTGSGKFPPFTFKALYEKSVKNHVLSSYDPQNTNGIWIKVPKGNNQKKLRKLICNGQHDWCVWLPDKAESYTENFSNYVFLSQDREGNFTIPRVLFSVPEIPGIDQKAVYNLAGNLPNEQLDDAIKKVLPNINDLLSDQSIQERFINTVEIEVTINKLWSMLKSDNVVTDQMIILFYTPKIENAVSQTSRSRIREFRNGRSSIQRQNDLLRYSRLVRR